MRDTFRRAASVARLSKRRAWIDPNFNDNSWSSGVAKLGLGGDGEVTYPYHPQCGARVVVFRRRTRGGQAQYDAVDVLGGSPGIPPYLCGQKSADNPVHRSVRTLAAK